MSMATPKSPSVSIKEGQTIKFIPRDANLEARVAPYYDFYTSLQGTVAKLYDDGTAAVIVDRTTLPEDARERHEKSERDMRDKWMRSLSEEDRNKLSDVQKQFNLRYTLLISVSDLIDVAGTMPIVPEKSRSKASEEKVLLSPPRPTEKINYGRRGSAFRRVETIGRRRLTVGDVVGLGSTAIGLAVPLLLGSLGEVVVERSGVINVGIEGMMLCGAFAGFALAQITQNAFIGAIAAALAGLLLALVFALQAILFRADQVVIGTAINILALGLTGVLYAVLSHDSSLPTHVPSFRPVPIPYLCNIPVIGRILFDQDALTYFAILLVPVLTFFLDKTIVGLRMRACGEYPVAAEASGVNVNMIRVAAIAFGGGMAGLAGAHMSIAYTISFAQGMTNGAGFIALAVVIVGRWKPVGVLLAAILFGLANAMQFDLQAVGAQIPYQLVLSLPYLLTLGALMLDIKRLEAAPTMLGAAYSRTD